MNHPLSRRQMLRTATLLSFGAATALSLRPAEAAIGPIKRTGGAQLKPALNAYSFSDLLVANQKDPSKGLDLFQLCEFCARHNFEAVDLTGYFFPGYPQAPEDSYLYRLKRHCQHLGLAISGTGVRNDFTSADPAVRAEGVQRVKTWVEVAARLGAPVIRVFCDSQPPHKNWQAAAGNAPRAQVEEWVAASIRECANHGQKFGVIIGVQNHGDFVSTAPEHLELLRRVDHEWCGAIVDTGKYNTADPYADIALAAPYAVNWQVKESPYGAADKPRTDMKKLVEIIRASGYRGYLPIETLSQGRKDYDPYRLVPEFLAELRAALG
jgi:sugar phosphate isomerase/epimerase